LLILLCVVLNKAACIIVYIAQKCNQQEGPLTELVFTAFDLQGYVQEALPALKAAVYRGDLSQAKDVLTLHDEPLYEEYDLSQALIEEDYSWVFTEAAADPEAMDPEGQIIGLTYPLILIYHHPELFQMEFGSLELDGLLDKSQSLPIQPGFREGLRAMWEIVGYITPEATMALQQYLRTAGRERAIERSAETLRAVEELADGLKVVVERGLALVVERD
jgi:hypothetical protein